MKRYLDPGAELRISRGVFKKFFFLKSTKLISRAFQNTKYALLFKKKVCASVISKVKKDVFGKLCLKLTFFCALLEISIYWRRWFRIFMVQSTVNGCREIVTKVKFWVVRGFEFLKREAEPPSP